MEPTVQNVPITRIGGEPIHYYLYQCRQCRALDVLKQFENEGPHPPGVNCASCGQGSGLSLAEQMMAKKGALFVKEVDASFSLEEFTRPAAEASAEEMSDADREATEGKPESANEAGPAPDPEAPIEE